MGKIIDETGNRYGRLVVLEKAERPASVNQYDRCAYWRCRCDCGNEHIVRGSRLRGAESTHCGCLSNFIDETGKRHGRLVVLERAESVYSADQGAYWRCRCDCGNEYVTRGARLRRGETTDCGCKHSEMFPPGRAAFNTVYYIYRRNAKKRGLSFELTKEDFSFLTQMNCSYCGDPPGTVQHNRNGERGHYIFTGIDRIDPEGGYTMDNVVPCCTMCNFMKRDYSRKAFLAQVEKIHARRVN